MSYSCEVVLDSISDTRNRLTTFKLTFPRIVLAEFNTHRMLSRNSASSRAIPFYKMLESVQKNPFIPIKFMKKHKGMQGTEYFTDKYDIDRLTDRWLRIKDVAIKQAKGLNDVGLTKQLCNRLLESFMWHTVICTATDYQNFFALRAHEAAEIHIQKIAYMMLREYNKSKPVERKWHIPFVDDLKGVSLKDKIKVSIARCARVSYTTVGENKVFDFHKDVELYDRLISMGHLSPTEHVAKAGPSNEYCGNFKGWIQCRKTIDGENRRDERVINKLE